MLSPVLPYFLFFNQFFFSSMEKLARPEEPSELPHVWVGTTPTCNYPYTATFRRTLLRPYKVRSWEMTELSCGFGCLEGVRGGSDAHCSTGLWLTRGCPATAQPGSASA